MYIKGGNSGPGLQHMIETTPNEMMCSGPLDIYFLSTQLISLSINIGNNTLSLLSLAGHPITHKAFRIDYKDIPYRPIYM
jgi:hypothetical protein